ncbi:DUF2695 domain-containing protein [Georgenia muralis]|uniref:Uncharacterized protein DUF2695 n=1 Tax=Georgenia muralis TaxID=154117 RepID=A0A3N4ZSC0_9MICO|nr:DUF2695 domain-containing protein [Georgenia muralis]RPF28408.1 uncharacterized protein DUF2695 [Georgenia muralis]
MTVDDGIGTLEIELAELAQGLTEPGPGECLQCFTNRMLVEFGCDCSLRWARRWREVRAPRAYRLLERLGRRGAYCDCEIFLNGWDVTVEPVVDPVTGESRWPAEVDGCRGVRTGSTLPCSLWTERRR